jgi:3-hydroxy-3-methylglutaryl CoA synthase
MFLGTTQAIAAGAQFDQSIVNDFDFREATRDAVRGLGVPSGWIRDKKEADDLVKAQAEATKQRQELETVAAAGGAAQMAGDGLASVAQAARTVA